METVSPALAAQLQARRTVLNERFSRSKRVFPDLDPAAFTRFLTNLLDPLVVAAEKINPGALPEFIDTAFAIGIELTGKKIIGPDARSGAVEKLWKAVFPAVIGCIVPHPAPMLVKLSNAVYQLDAEVHARCDEWLALVTAHAHLCDDSATLLALAQVCAWKCGMAHYRRSAVPLLASLPKPLCRALFQIVDECNCADEAGRFLADPWYAPAYRTGNPRQPVTYCAGGFRGLGGPFIRPPLAMEHQGKLLLWCDGEWWIVHADIFGVTCKRLIADLSSEIPRPAEIDGKKSRSGGNGIIIDGGTVAVQGRTFDLSPEGTVSGAAFASNTLLVSLENSHLVWIFEVGKP